MKAKEYAVLVHAVEMGIMAGVRQAYKHVDGTPPDDTQQSYIADAVINSICEWFDFEHDVTKE